MGDVRNADAKKPLSKQDALKLAGIIFNGTKSLGKELDEIREIYDYEDGEVSKKDMLWRAIFAEEGKAVDRMLARYNIDPNTADGDSHPLTVALAFNLEEIAKVLLDRGADVEKAMQQIVSKEGDFEDEAYSMAFSLAKKLLKEREGRKFRKVYEKYFFEMPQPTDKERKMLTALGMNGRLAGKRLREITGIEENEMAKLRDDVEKKFRLRYTAELDINKLGYLSYIVLVKFDDEQPDTDTIKKAVEEQPSVQLAMETRGDYHLVLYMLARNNDEIRIDIYNIRDAIGPSYNSHWYIAPFYATYGFVPIREKFFDLIKERVWTPKKDQRVPAEGQFFKREYALMKELCIDGSIDFTEIDKKYGFETGRSLYAYARLKEKGIIKRITAIQNLPIHSDILLVAKVNQEATGKNRKVLLEDVIQNTKDSVSRYALVGDIGMPDGVLYIVPTYNYDELNRKSDIEEYALSLSEKLDGTEATALDVRDILIGTIPYRLFDYVYTNQYKALVDLYKMEKSERIEYDDAKKGRKYGFRKEELTREGD